jgi:hypothetical protein
MSSRIPLLWRKASSEDAWGAEGVFVSWPQWRNGPDVLGNGALVLLPDVLWSELNIDQRGLNLCMTHELHQRGEANAPADHVGGECVPEPVRIRLRHARGLPVMTEQRTQTCGCHPAPAGGPFEANEQSLAASGRPFQTQVVTKKFHGFASQRHDTYSFALALDPDL